MSGIDRERIVGKNEDELDELTCGICQDIFDDPVVTQCCRQTYCTICINQWLVDNNTCPNDRKSLDINGLAPSSISFINLLNKLKIKCSNSNNGCHVILKIVEMKDHEMICDKNFFSCRNSKETIKQKETDVHTLQEKLESDLGKVRVARN